MSTAKLGAVLAFGLIFVAASPALAHKDGTEWLSMMQRLQQQRSIVASTQAAKAPVSIRKSKVRTDALARPGR